MDSVSICILFRLQFDPFEDTNYFLPCTLIRQPQRAYNDEVEPCFQFV